MTIHNSFAELIGNTPLVKLNHIPQAAGVKATIAVKVEYFNPGGSSKDRIAERIIDAAEQSGQLKPGGVIVVLLQCLFDRFGSVFPQCGLMVFPGVVIVSR